MLQFNNITKIYSGTVALKNINIEVTEGDVLGVIGKNGAGKTTLVGIMSGIIAPTEGEIIIKGRKYRSLTRQRARKEGVAIVTQEAEVIPDWTVAENLFVPDFICSWNRQTIKWKKMFSLAKKILDKHNVLIGVNERAKDLTISEQQLLLIMKACYIEDSKIIIFDEVSTSLSKNEQEILYKIIGEQKKKGKAIIYISHRMDEILKICDHVTVIRDGMVVDNEKCANLTDQQLSAYIIGEDAAKEPESPIQGTKHSSEEEVLRINKLSRKGIFENISLSLKKGEIVGFAGLRGSRRTDVLKAIAGIDPADGGRIALNGKKTALIKSPNIAIKKGIAYLTENRDKEGLVDILTVKENLTLSMLKSIIKFGMISGKKEKKTASFLINLLSIHTPSYNEVVGNLSGGNRQKVMFGKVIATKPSVYLLDEPTKGIDISAKKDILSFIKEKIVENAGVILTLPEIKELIEICDRILVLYNGKITATFTQDRFSEVDIYNATQGLNEK